MGMFYYSQEILSLHKITNNDKNFLFYKVQYIVGIAGTDKTDNLTCENIYDNSTRENYRFSKLKQSSIITFGYLILVEKIVVYIIK